MGCGASVDARRSSPEHEFATSKRYVLRYSRHIISGFTHEPLKTRHKTREALQWSAHGIVALSV
jgi:hypothetical protein